MATQLLGWPAILHKHPNPFLVSMFNQLDIHICFRIRLQRKLRSDSTKIIGSFFIIVAQVYTESNTFSFSLFNCFGYKALSSSELSIISFLIKAQLKQWSCHLFLRIQFYVSSFWNSWIFHFRKNHHFSFYFVLNRQTRLPSMVFCKVF
jgi:hypothetical protein